ncbi:conserved hypothetical protein [delta proteobacterium NaphS2]|nr:conserved hypothetical protein [delta proteobacterium NaphS2]
MISDTYDIDTFFKAIEKKDLSEIISFADREALAAWRRAYRQKKDGKSLGDLPARYENTLEELISFLRTALPARPFEIDETLFERFLKLRWRVFGEMREPFDPVSSKTLPS